MFGTDAELKTLAQTGKPGKEDGDGTVPHESGLAPGKTGGAIEQFSLNGFDHQGAYMTEVHDVMTVSRYAIARIAQKADWGDA